MARTVGYAANTANTAFLESTSPFRGKPLPPLPPSFIEHAERWGMGWVFSSDDEPHLVAKCGHMASEDSTRCGISWQLQPGGRYRQVKGCRAWQQAQQAVADAAESAAEDAAAQAIPAGKVSSW